MSSEAFAKEVWSFGGLRRTIGATGSYPWGSTSGKKEPFPGAAEVLTSFYAKIWRMF